MGILSSRDRPLFGMGLNALATLQTRGYDGTGYTALQSRGSVLYHKSKGAIKEAFPSTITTMYDKHDCYQAQFQVRYGTSGGFSHENVQPYITRHKSSHDIFMVSHNGQFSDRSGTQIDGLSDTAGFVERLSHSQGATWDERIRNTLASEKGAWSLIIGTDDCMYLSRDSLGIRPLYFSQKSDDGENLTMAASETVALESAGFDTFNEVLPGELVKIDRFKPGYVATRITEIETAKNCMFENVYTLDENGRAFLPGRNRESVNESPSVAQIRTRCGEQLALEAPLTIAEIDFVIGIPGTAITGGIGYARKLGLPYYQAITDKSTPAFEQRTFMQAQIEGIMEKVLNHFNFDAEYLRGKRVVLVDDSIVRANISRGLVTLLRKYGVNQVHFRVLCPPIDKACFLGINTRTQSELIAARHKDEATNYDELVELIRKDIGVDSLAYLSDKGLLLATSGNANAEGFCMGCMVGHKHPIDQYGHTQ